MAHVTRDGVALYYEQHGRGDPPLVMVHGWCCDHSLFGPQVERFSRSHHVTTLDLRGCGRSDRPAAASDAYSMSTLADDVAWLCEEAGIGRPVLIGHSMGGSVCIELAARHPELPAAVVALDPGSVHATPEAARVYAGLAEQLLGPSGEAVRRAWIDGPDLEGLEPDVARHVLDTMCSVPLDVAAASLRGANDWNGLAALAMCYVPLLVVRSRVGGSNDPARLATVKPDVHVGVTVGAGHFHQLVVPDQVNAMIGRFLETTVGGSDR